MATLFSLIVMVIVTGCAHFQDAPINAPASAKHLQSRRLDATELRQFFTFAHIVYSPVWNLDQLTFAAVFYHPDMALARAQAESAEAAQITAGQRPNPSISLTPTWVSNLTSAPPWLFASLLSVPIETAGKRGYRIDKAKQMSEAASLRIADSAWLVRNRLRLAMLDVYFAQENLRLVQEQVRLEQTIDQHVLAQFNAGEIAETDRLTAQLGAQQMQLTLSAAQKKLADSQTLLAEAIGIPALALVDKQLDFSEFAAWPNLKLLTTSKMRTVALHQRPDVLASLADYAAAQSALQLEIANQYPNFQANPSYVFNTGEHRWSLGAGSIQLPLFNQNEGPIAEMTAKRQEAEQRFEALQLRILGEIDRAHANALAMQSRREAASLVVKNRSDNLRLLQNLYLAGEQDAHAMAVAELELNVAKKGLLDVLFESQQVFALLETTLRQSLSPRAAKALFTDNLRKLPK